MDEWRPQGIAAIDEQNYAVTLRADSTTREYTFTVENTPIGVNSVTLVSSAGFAKDSLPSQASATAVFAAVRAFHEARQSVLTLTPGA